MPRDRQMMIKKAPVRVRTTPRRPVPTPAPRSPPSPPPLSPPSPPPCLPPSPPPAILLPLFLSRFSPPRVTLPLPPAGRGLSLSLFFFPSLDFRSFPLSSSVPLLHPFGLFSFSASLSTLRLHVCRVHHGPRRTTPNGSSAICY